MEKRLNCLNFVKGTFYSESCSKCKVFSKRFKYLKDLKGTAVNRVLPYLPEGSHETSLTVPLTEFILFKFYVFTGFSF